MLLSDRPYNFRLKDITKIRLKSRDGSNERLESMNNVMAEKRGVALSPNNLSFRPLFHRDRAVRGQGVGVLSVTACPDQEGAHST